MKKYVHLFSIILLSIFISLSSYANSNEKKTKKKAAHWVEISPANYQKHSQTIHSRAYIYPEKVAKIANQIEGTLIEFPLNKGDSFKRGDLIGRLDKSIYHLNLEEAKIQLKQQQINLEQIKQLSPKKLVSDDQLIRAKTQLNLAKVKLKRQKLQLSYTDIYAPFDGFVSQKLVNQGEYLTKNKHLITLYGKHDYFIEFNIDKSLVNILSLGSVVDMSMSKLSGNKQNDSPVYKAMVKSVYPDVNPQNHQLTYRASLKMAPDSSAHFFPSGLPVEILFNYKSQKLISAPLSAVRTDNSQSYVYTYDKQKQQATKRMIKTGKLLPQHQIEVLSGINYNDMIITKGIYQLKPGKKVQIFKQSSNDSNKPKH